MPYKKSVELPLDRKILLTAQEAATLTGLGRDKIRRMGQAPGCTWTLWNGSKLMIKREAFVEFLTQTNAL